MAVYKRNYKPYEGRVSQPRTRFLVISRYALETLLQSRLLVGLLVASCIFPLFALAVITFVALKDVANGNMLV